MKIRNTSLSFFIFLLLILLSPKEISAQCFQIESILVDACSSQEGLNEMVRFKVGATAINTNNMSVSWPNNPWVGLVKNSITAAKTAALNADILDAGGCGQLIEPTNGVLPANASVILVTSFNLDTAMNSFGALTNNTYIIYQNNETTASGHFANSGSGLRTLTISFGSCSDSVTYNRALLVDTNGATVAADGAIVLFTTAGAATYINNGCSAPVPPFTVDAGPATINACSGTTVVLAGSAQGQLTVNWRAASGSFSTPGNLATNYTISPSATGIVVLTLTAVNSCGLEITDTVNINVTTGSAPNFTTPISICTGTTAPVLNTISPNGISGTWTPAIVSNTSSGDYRFVPNAGQCASDFVLHVNVGNSIVPNFTTPISICIGATSPVLNMISPNGISGTWTPAIVSNTTSGDYRFVPNSGQCASDFVLHVDVGTSIVPNFSTPISICTGATVPVLNTTSPNGISGIWTPAIVSNTTSGDYRFVPNAGQCASDFVLHVNVGTSIIPNFTTPVSICIGATPPVLNTISPNGISGIWIPATINNTASGDYRFVPNAGQCALDFVLHVNVGNSIVPNFTTPISICTGATAPVLNTISPNGISGIWTPATINNTTGGDYRFVPNAGQCASDFVLHVNVGNSIVPNFTTPISICTGATGPVLNTTSPNGISGIWTPAIVSNTTSGDYRFVPNAGQCASDLVLHVNVGNSIVPNFTTPVSICTGSTAPVLNTISPNGISGIWTPAIVSNTSSGDYRFVPTAGQCASDFVLHVNVGNSIVPNFTTPISICTGATAPILNTISPNGISGIWTPAIINNTASGDYRFVPNAGQCASDFALHVNVGSSIAPDFPSVLSICNASNLPVLDQVSPNGITGSWNPAAVNPNIGSYIFTPNPGQCAQIHTLNINWDTLLVTVKKGCVGQNYMLEAMGSSSYQYEWKDEQGRIVSASALLNATDLLSGAAQTTFPVTYKLTATANGCSVSQYETVDGIFCSIPRGISPNSDNKNDTFDLTGLGVKELTVFNRYGTEVYHAINYKNEWNGSSKKGDLLPDGVYYYVIDTVSSDHLTGWVYVNK